MALSGAAAWADTGADEKAVIAAEHQAAKANQTNNVDLAASLTADNYVSTDQDGTVFVGKAANLADMKVTTWTSNEITDLKVTVYGDAAIATGTFVAKGTYKGKPFDDRGRFTDTWVKMNGKWLIVASHASLIKK
jgi:ketosteroid isomerase-like protein